MIKIINNTLIIKIEGRNICMAAGGLPTSGSKGCDSCMFLFTDDEWDGLTKSVVFWQDKQTRYEIPLGENDVCDIPAEALEQDGFLFLGLIGRGEGVLQNSKVLLVPLCDGTRAGNAIPEES